MNSLLLCSPPFRALLANTFLLRNIQLMGKVKLHEKTLKVKPKQALCDHLNYAAQVSSIVFYTHIFLYLISIASLTSRNDKVQLGLRVNFIVKS